MKGEKDMRRKWEYEFTKLRMECADIVDRGDEHSIMYLSCSKYGKEKLLELLIKFREGYEIDYMLGIIDKYDADRLIKIHDVVLDSINNAVIY